MAKEEAVNALRLGLESIMKPDVESNLNSAAESFLLRMFAFGEGRPTQAQILAGADMVFLNGLENVRAAREQLETLDSYETQDRQLENISSVYVTAKRYLKL